MMTMFSTMRACVALRAFYVWRSLWRRRLSSSTVVVLLAGQILLCSCSVDVLISIAFVTQCSNINILFAGLIFLCLTFLLL
jgi:hypothetical protein